MENNFEQSVCPACGIIDRFGDKWSLRILVLLHTHGVLRFSELLRRTPGISQRMLSLTLRSLEADNLVDRKVYAEVPPRVEYSLTSLGDSLIPVLDGVIRWAVSHAGEISSHRERYYEQGAPGNGAPSGSKRE